MDVKIACVLSLPLPIQGENKILYYKRQSQKSSIILNNNIKQIGILFENIKYEYMSDCGLS